MKKRIFISGAISGDPEYRAKFAKAKAKAEALYPDCIVYTPPELIDEHKRCGRTFSTEADCLLSCLLMLRECDYHIKIAEPIVSMGTIIEVMFSEYAGIEILPQLSVG